MVVWQREYDCDSCNARIRMVQFSDGNRKAYNVGKPGLHKCGRSSSFTPPRRRRKSVTVHAPTPNTAVASVRSNPVRPLPQVDFAESSQSGNLLTVLSFLFLLWTIQGYLLG